MVLTRGQQGQRTTDSLLAAAHSRTPGGTFNGLGATDTAGVCGLECALGSQPATLPGTFV